MAEPPGFVPPLPKDPPPKIPAMFVKKHSVKSTASPSDPASSGAGVCISAESKAKPAAAASSSISTQAHPNLDEEMGGADDCQLTAPVVIAAIVIDRPLANGDVSQPSGEDGKKIFEDASLSEGSQPVLASTEPALSLKDLGRRASSRLRTRVNNIAHQEVDVDGGSMCL